MRAETEGIVVSIVVCDDGLMGDWEDVAELKALVFFREPNCC